MDRCICHHGIERGVRLSLSFIRNGSAASKLTLKTKIDQCPHFGLSKVGEGCPPPASFLPSPARGAFSSTTKLSLPRQVFLKLNLPVSATAASYSELPQVEWFRLDLMRCLEQSS